MISFMQSRRKAISGRPDLVPIRPSMEIARVASWSPPSARGRKFQPLIRKEFVVRAPSNAWYDPNAVSIVPGGWPGYQILKMLSG